MMRPNAPPQQLNPHQLDRPYAKQLYSPETEVRVVVVESPRTRTVREKEARGAMVQKCRTNTVQETVVPAALTRPHHRRERPVF